MARTRAARITNFSSRTAPRASALWSRLHARLYRSSGGRFVPRWFGAPVLVLETVGRKSGRARATPLVYARDGERFVIAPASGGTNTDPAWWLNLKAAGEGTVTVGGERRRVRPRVAEGEERERLWRKLCDAYPGNRDYVDLLGRELTVVVLEPV